VTDTADAYLCALGHRGIKPGTTINLGTGQAFSVGAVYEKLQTLTGNRKTISADAARIRPERSEVMRLISDNRSAKELIDWSPRVTFDRGLEKVVEYWRERSAGDAALYHV
jgi:nucleoside-diphosphate-sugar epimerase